MQPQYYGAAADYNKPKGNSLLGKKVLFIAGGSVLGLILIAVFFTVLGAITSGPRNDVARLAAREQQLQKFVDSNLNSIKSGDLRKVSGEAQLYLGTDVSALQKVYGDKLPGQFVEAEADTTSAQKLKDATQAGKFDETFADLLAAKVTSALEQAQKVKEQTSGKETRAVATQAVTNLTAISEQLSKLTL